MEGCDETLLRRRVVVLGDGPALASHLAEVLGPAADVVRADSGYEAAAELLAEPCGVLVVDFRRLPPVHVPLLDIARRGEVEVLAMGATPEGVPVERLSGIRLVSRADLPDAVLRALPHAGQATEAPPAAAPAGRPARQAAPAESPDLTEPADDGEAVSAPGPARPQPPLDAERPHAPAGDAPSRLLTPEELAALLEDGP